ncbi:MAG: hypothetical protein HZB38_07015 [Planctomycetes bacterium]|nr:hypothetical protein [Planctomycetota bacterium]
MKYRLRRAASRNVVLGLVAAALLGAAALILLRSGSTGSEMHDKSTWVYLKCEGCNEEFHMDAAEIDTAFRTKQVVNVSKDEMGGDMRFKCAKCKQMKAKILDDQPANKP